MGIGHHKHTMIRFFYSIPSTLMFVSFNSELQEDPFAKLLSREEGRYLTTFCRGVVSTGA